MRRPAYWRSLLAFTLLMALAISSTAEGRGVELTIDLNGDTFVVGETIDLRLNLVNTGAAPVEIPDIGVPGVGYPVYTLTGPDYPEGIRFIKIPLNDHERPPSASPPGRKAPPPPMRSIAPGQVLKNNLAISRTIQVDQPGNYSISARLAQGSVDVATAPLAFRILPNTYLGASLALDGAATDRQFRVVWLGEGGGVRRIGEAFLTERRQDTGEITRPGVRRIHELPAGATGAFAPWSNYDRADALFHWDGWREAGRLIALQAGAAGPLQADLGSAAAWMVAPALMPRSGRLLVFAVDPQHDRLVTALFLPDSAAAPAVATRPLGFPAVAGTAALPPAGDAAEVLLVGSVPAIQPPNAPLRHDLVLAIQGLDPNAPPRRAVVAGVAAMPGSSPAFRIDADGTDRVSVIALADAEPNTMVLVDAVFPPGREPPRTTVTPLPPSGRSVTAAAVAFQLAAAADARDWAVLFADGELVSGRSARGPIRPAPRPAVPLQLVVQPAVTYVLSTDPVSGPMLLALH